MKVGYHPDVQKDVSRILKRYDEISDGLGDEFWDELMSRIEAAAANPFLFRPLPDRIRVTVVRHHKQSPESGLERR